MAKLEGYKNYDVVLIEIISKMKKKEIDVVKVEGGRTEFYFIWNGYSCELIPCSAVLFIKGEEHGFITIESLVDGDDTSKLLKALTSAASENAL